MTFDDLLGDPAADRCPRPATSVGGLDPVVQMTRARLKALADRIPAAVPQPVASH